MNTKKKLPKLIVYMNTNEVIVCRREEEAELLKHSFKKGVRDPKNYSRYPVYDTFFITPTTVTFNNVMTPR